MNATAEALGVDAARPLRSETVVRRLARNPTVVFGVVILALIVAMGIAAPWLANFDPAAINPTFRNKLPGAVETVRADDGTKTEVRHWMGTDSLGRDVASRVVYGARASLLIGVSVAVIAVGIGLVIGLAAGYVRWLDGIVMRLMDGLMAIPAILLAIAVVSLSSAGLVAVIVAIVIPEVPRVVRLVRSVVLSVREEPYVEAAIAVGTPTLAAGHPPHPAQHAAAAYRAGDLHLRLGDSDRGHPFVSRRRHSVADADLGQHHGGGADLVPRLSAQHPVPGHLPRADGARGQPARRRTARHAGSPPAQAPMSALVDR